MKATDWGTEWLRPAMGTGTDGLDSCAPMRWYGSAKEETLVQQCNALEARRIFRRPSPWAVTVDPNGAEVDGKQ